MTRNKSTAEKNLSASKTGHEGETKKTYGRNANNTE